MITITLFRYYGDVNITKSLVTIENEEGRVLFRGEARENGFRQYRRGEEFYGHTRYCLAEGEYVLRETTDDCMTMCYRIVDDPRRRGCRITCFDSKKQATVNKVNVGFANECEDPEIRRMVDIDRAREEFIRIIYENYQMGARLRVTNEKTLSPNLARPREEHFAQSLPKS